MDEQEFKRLLDLFPPVRSRDYSADEDSSGQSTSQSSRDSLVKELQGALGEVEDSESRNVVEQSGNLQPLGPCM